MWKWSGGERNPVEIIREEVPIVLKLSSKPLLRLDLDDDADQVHDQSTEEESQVNQSKIQDGRLLKVIEDKLRGVSGTGEAFIAGIREAKVSRQSSGWEAVNISWWLRSKLEKFKKRSESAFKPATRDDYVDYFMELFKS